MGLFSGKSKEIEPQYQASLVNNQVLNYKVYKMTSSEKLLYSALAMLAGGFTGLVFYADLFMSYGERTIATHISNVVVFLLVGLLARKFFLPMRTKQLQKKRVNILKRQFIEFLVSLSTSLSSGMNVQDSLKSVVQDLTFQFTAESFIVKEVNEMLAGLTNGVDIEALLEDFGKRSGVEDIANFSKVFSICYRTGGNLQEVVSRSSSIISEKILIAEEIETKLTSNKTQFLAMNVVPIILVLMLRVMSRQFAESFASLIGVVAITVAVGIFIAAYRMGEKIMDVKG